MAKAATYCCGRSFMEIVYRVSIADGFHHSNSFRNSSTARWMDLRRCLDGRCRFVWQRLAAHIFALCGPAHAMKNATGGLMSSCKVLYYGSLYADPAGALQNGLPVPAFVRKDSMSDRLAALLCNPMFLLQDQDTQLLDSSAIAWNVLGWFGMFLGVFGWFWDLFRCERIDKFLWTSMKCTHQGSPGYFGKAVLVLANCKHVCTGEIEENRLLKQVLENCLGFLLICSGQTPVMKCWKHLSCYVVWTELPDQAFCKEWKKGLESNGQ